MSDNQKKAKGCGCSNIPISLVLVILGGGYWWFSQQDINIRKLVAENIPINIPGLNSATEEPPITPTPPLFSSPVKPENKPVPPVASENSPTKTTEPTPTTTAEDPATEESTPTSIENSPTKTTEPTPTTTAEDLVVQTAWEKKSIRGIYLSRYQITNNASEEAIRQRVRYYHSQGINTIIHGVWGNACTMYNSEVMQQTFGYSSCPNLFQDPWLEWLIDEAHKHDMEVHAYFEKGIKIDKDSPIFDLAIARKWIVPGVDRTYAGVDHYILDVEIPEVAEFFSNILVEFVQKYPTIDAVQWDDYLGYHAELPGKIDRTEQLTNFLQDMIGAMKQANPDVSFDLCHHNPYWAKRYFAADWEQWGIDRAFIQAYNEKNFQAEVEYAEQHAGIAITDEQLHRLPEIVENEKIEGILVFPLSGMPQETASKLKELSQK